MRRLALFVSGLLLAGLTVQSDLRAQTPLSREAAAEREWLFEALRTAPTEDIGRAIEDQIWRFWMRQAPDPASAQMMTQATERRRSYDFAGR